MRKHCVDCVEVHGDNPDEWAKQWPGGAEYHEKYKAFLCDGCFDEREDQQFVSAEDHAMDAARDYDVGYYDDAGPAETSWNYNMGRG